MAILAEAEAVMASEAISAAPIRTKRLMRDTSQSRDRDVGHNFPAQSFVPVRLKQIVAVISRIRLLIVPGDCGIPRNERCCGAVSRSYGNEREKVAILLFV